MQTPSDNEYGILIAKKAEKLVTALYLVTGLIEDSEPIKTNTRALAGTLLSSIHTLAQPEVLHRAAEYKVSLIITTEIVSLLNIATTVGIVSPMNGSLLIEGFTSLQKILEKKQPYVSREMLYVEEEENLGEKVNTFPTLRTSSYLFDTTEKYDAVYEQGSKTTNEEEKKQDRLFAKNPVENKRQDFIQKGQVSNSTVLHGRKGTRREQILSLFTKGTDMSIKDISSRVKGCSEKTIQRELNALMYENIILRIGEKRWSRYILK